MRRPFRVGDRVALRRKLRSGEPTRGTIHSFDRDCFGARAALVVWNVGINIAREQLCLTSDLKRVK